MKGAREEEVGLRGDGWGRGEEMSMIKTCKKR